MIKKIHALLILVIVIGAAFVGCGSDSESDDSTKALSSEPITVAASSLTKAQFIKQAEAVCRNERREMGDQLRIYGKKIGENQSEAEAVNATKESIFIPGVERHIEDFEELGAPKGEEAKVEALLTALQEGLQAAETTPLAGLEQFSVLFHRFDKLADDYGMDGCSFE